MTSVEEIEEHIKPLLLTELTFLIEDKKVKSGKLILFSVRDFFCVFTFLDTVKQKKISYEIPYPFAIKQENNKLVFDYTVDAFSDKSEKFIFYVTNILRNKKPAKLYNKKMFILSHV